MSIKQQFASNFVLHWDLKNGSLYDRSGNGGNLTPTNTPAWVGGHSRGQAIAFNGTNNFLSTTSNIRTSDSQGTIAAWVKLKTLGISNYFFTACDVDNNVFYFIFRVSTLNRLNITQKSNDTDDSILGNTTFVADRWYHVVVTSDGSTYAMYVNGAPEVLSSLSGANTGDWIADTANVDNLAIGALNRQTKAYSNTIVGEIVYFNTALTPAQVAQLYAESLQEACITGMVKRNFISAANCKYRNTFEDATATISNLTSGSLGDFNIAAGTWAIGEDATGKYLSCVANGQVKTPLTGASGFTTGTFTETGSATLTKNANDLQIDAVAGDKIYEILINP